MSDEPDEVDVSKVKAFEPDVVPETLDERIAREAIQIATYRINDDSEEAKAWRQENARQAAERQSVKTAAIERMAQILLRHGIEMRVTGCGCCGSPEVRFVYLGETILDDEDEVNFDTNKHPAFDLDAPRCED